MCKRSMKPTTVHTLYIIPDLWPPNSHDLIIIIGIIQQRVYQRNMQDVTDVRQRLIDVWVRVEESIVDNAIT